MGDKLPRLDGGLNLRKAEAQKKPPGISKPAAPLEGLLMTDSLSTKTAVSTSQEAN